MIRPISAAQHMHVLRVSRFNTERKWGSLLIRGHALRMCDQPHGVGRYVVPKIVKGKCLRHSFT